MLCSVDSVVFDEKFKGNVRFGGYLSPLKEADSTEEHNLTRPHGLGQKALGRSMCISQTTLRDLQDFGLEIGPEFLKIVGIVRFADFPQVPLRTPGQHSRPGDGGHPAELDCMAPSYET